jgi:hypothetical protein
MPSANEADLRAYVCVRECVRAWKGGGDVPEQQKHASHCGFLFVVLVRPWILAEHEDGSPNREPTCNAVLPHRVPVATHDVKPPRYARRRAD